MNHPILLSIGQWLKPLINYSFLVILVCFLFLVVRLLVKRNYPNKNGKILLIPFFIIGIIFITGCEKNADISPSNPMARIKTAHEILLPEVVVEGHYTPPTFNSDGGWGPNVSGDSGSSGGSTGGGGGGTGSSGGGTGGGGIPNEPVGDDDRPPLVDEPGDYWVILSSNYDSSSKIQVLLTFDTSQHKVVSVNAHMSGLTAATSFSQIGPGTSTYNASNNTYSYSAQYYLSAGVEATGPLANAGIKFVDGTYNMTTKQGTMTIHD